MTDRTRPEFLTVEDVLVIQRDQLKRYGGDSGLRDLGLLNGVAVPFSESLYDLTMAVARGEMQKADIAEKLRRIVGNEVPEATS